MDSNCLKCILMAPFQNERSSCVILSYTTIRSLLKMLLRHLQFVYRTMKKNIIYRLLLLDVPLNVVHMVNRHTGILTTFLKNTDMTEFNLTECPSAIRDSRLCSKKNP